MIDPTQAPDELDELATLIMDEIRTRGDCPATRATVRAYLGIAAREGIPTREPEDPPFEGDPIPSYVGE